MEKEIVLNKNWVRCHDDNYYRGWNHGYAGKVPIAVLEANTLEGAERDNYIQGHYDGWMLCPNKPGSV